MKKNVILSVFLVAMTASLSIAMHWRAFRAGGAKEGIYFSTDMTLKDLARKNSVPLKELLHKLSHEGVKAWDLPRDVPIKTLGIDAHRIEHALEHARLEQKPFVALAKYILWALWISLVLLFILTRQAIRRSRIIALLIVVLLFGVLFGATPNPMESIVKLFKMFNRMQGRPVAVILSFILFSLFSLAGSKMICSWGCPLGALQESLFSIPLFKRKYAFKLPFFLSLPVRCVLFIAFFLLLFGIGLGIRNFVIYHHVNYFKIFDYKELAVVALYSLPLLGLLSFFLYRPFCQLVCPFGLYAWVLENMAVNKIRIDESRCIQCGKCITACPTQAMKGICEKKRAYFLPDCWSCGACIEACPEGAVHYGPHGSIAGGSRTSSGDSLSRGT
jgi:ferredoxin